MDHEFLALERELTYFLRRARSSSGEMAREVHPDLEPAAYGLLARLEECGAQRATDLAGYIG
ncbi:MarR family transcriptional regulator, partial [Streptomyces sp. SID5785]|nr:MarR family transcriptional regulator [Streptomyces sp. SID5785]